MPNKHAYCGPDDHFTSYGDFGISYSDADHSHVRSAYHNCFDHYTTDNAAYFPADRYSAHPTGSIYFACYECKCAEWRTKDKR